jgi:ATP-dependent DNA helicase RecG
MMKNTESLREVLELERKKGFANKAVIGGLDRYLHKQAGQIRQTIADQRLLETFDSLNLGNSHYASWDIDKRKKWIANIFDRLQELEKTNKATRSVVKAGNGLSARVKPAAEGRNESLSSAVVAIKGITPNVANKLSKLNVKTIRDLLYFFPRRYLDYSQRKPIAELEEGEEQTIVAIVWEARVTALGNRAGTEAIVGDETGNIRVVWFNQPYLARNLSTNARVAISGRVSSFKGQKVFESPEWELLGSKELIHTARLVPVYPLTQGLYPRQVRRWMKELINGWAWQLRDFLPSEIRNRYHFLDLPEAITQAHYPDDWSMAEKARERLAFDELFLLQLGLLARKRDWQESQPGNPFGADQGIVDGFVDCLPFGLTEAQHRVLQEILADISHPKAMCRLLQGEVGSGKTVVATIALLIVAANSHQGALMAPTEILAEQHFNNICGYLSTVGTSQYHWEERDSSLALGRSSAIAARSGNVRCYAGFLSRPLTVALLVGSLKDSEKEDLHNQIQKGTVDVVIGTHALIQEGVRFHKLGLAVIDEQHRFGVVQRQKLRQKGFNPHILVMTATPIPRTMALTVYGDLDLSVIDQLPPGRQAVKTKYLEPEQIGKAYAFVRKEVRCGRQAFIICPIIDESEALEVRAATTEYDFLSREVFPDLRVGLLHGRMPANDKEDVMRRFRNGLLDILVSTSVVEVGIDVPEASVILVEGADRFGLSQLHQFRGRVGRNNYPGYCMLVPEKPSPEARNRLQLIEKIHDGFALAEEDLKLRGPGEFSGTQQSGFPELRVADLSNSRLLESARREAIALLQSDLNLEREEHTLLRKRVTELWSETTEWS